MFDLQFVKQTRHFCHSFLAWTQAELERQRAEEQRKAEENSGKLDAKEKEALLEQFKRAQVYTIGAPLRFLCPANFRK